MLYGVKAMSTSVFTKYFKRIGVRIDKCSQLGKIIKSLTVVIKGQPQKICSKKDGSHLEQCQFTKEGTLNGGIEITSLE